MLLNLILFSLLTASLAWFVQYCLQPGEILGKLGVLLTALWIKSNHKTFLLGQHNEVIKRKRWAYLLKPAGLCPYCQGAYIALLTYCVLLSNGFYGFIPKAIGLFLFLGANYIWTKILSKVAEW